MTRYILTQDMKAIIPFADEDQIKVVKREYRCYGEPESESYAIYVYYPDGDTIRGHLGTYKTITSATDMMNVLCDRLSDEVPVIFMLPDKEGVE